MPKYHFEIVDEYRLEDPIGMDVPTEEQARTVAKDIARQIVDDNAACGDLEVIVLDDKGDEIYTTAVDEKSTDV